jgi:hypothetical protein
MAKAKSLLCIGGPNSGQRVEFVNGDRFYAPLARLGGAARLPIAEKLIAYVEQRIRTPDDDVSFFVPEGQSARATIALLFDAYEKLAALAAKGLVDLDIAAEERDG